MCSCDRDYKACKIQNTHFLVLDRKVRKPLEYYTELDVKTNGKFLKGVLQLFHSLCHHITETITFPTICTPTYVKIYPNEASKFYIRKSSSLVGPIYQSLRIIKSSDKQLGLGAQKEAF